MMGLSILDWVIVFIVLFSVLQAISSGFVREFFAFAGCNCRIPGSSMGVSGRSRVLRAVS